MGRGGHKEEGPTIGSSEGARYFSPWPCVKDKNDIDSVDNDTDNDVRNNLGDNNIEYCDDNYNSDHFDDDHKQ